MKLLTEVIIHNPNADMNRWDRIAYNMNQFAYDHGVCVDKLLFYDGNSCYQVFNELAIVPYNKSLNEASVDTDVEMRNDHTTKKTNEHGNNSLPFELKTYILKALAVYRESDDKYWAEKYPELTV